VAVAGAARRQMVSLLPEGVVRLLVVVAVAGAARQPTSAHPPGSAPLRVRTGSSLNLRRPASTVMSQAVVREELTLIEMCSRGTHSAAFRDCCGAHPANVAGIRVAVSDLQTRLLGLVSKGGGEGASVFHTV